MGQTRQGKNTEGQTLVLERQKTKRPRRYWVVIHNDDYTTQEFVVHVLMKFFRKPPAEATKLMLMVHKEGKTRVCTYTKDIAESKVHVVTTYARENKMPLLLSSHPE